MTDALQFLGIVIIAVLVIADLGFQRRERDETREYRDRVRQRLDALEIRLGEIPAGYVPAVRPTRRVVVEHKDTSARDRARELSMAINRANQGKDVDWNAAD